MKRIRTIQLVIAAAILALPLAAGSDKCTNATLKGNFGSVLTGSVVGVGPFATVATVNFDGVGGWSYTESGSFNGNPIPPHSFTGAYSVKPQCTGSASDSGGNTVDFVIVGSGNNIEIFMVGTGHGAVFTVTLKRRFRSDD